jgi:cytochrome c-type biogenesis protein CcmH/NrfG
MGVMPDDAHNRRESADDAGGTRDRSPKASPHDGDAERTEGTRLIASGVGLGAVGAASAVVLGATCPLCIVGAPALVGWGVYKRWKAKGRATVAVDAPDAEPQPES